LGIDRGPIYLRSQMWNCWQYIVTAYWKNRHLEPENFNKELFLRVNLGPMHILKGLVNEVLAYDSSKNYARTGSDISKFASKDINKGSTIDNMLDEEESSFPSSFWNFKSTK
jgi:hypothetical protein